MTTGEKYCLAASAAALTLMPTAFVFGGHFPGSPINVRILVSHNGSPISADMVAVDKDSTDCLRGLCLPLFVLDTNCTVNMRVPEIPMLFVLCLKYRF